MELLGAVFLLCFMLLVSLPVYIIGKECLKQIFLYIKRVFRK